MTIQFSAPWAFCLVLCSLVAIAPRAQAGESVLRRPNILLIYADDHSPKTLSCYEQSYAMANTPHLDRLAARGVRFAAAYLGAWCMPSRASILTGLPPHSIQSMRMEGRYPGSTYDPEQCRFWPAVFRRHGYQTAQIGKWHTGVDAGWGRDWDFQIVWNRPDNPSNAGNYYGPQVLDFNGERRTAGGYATDNYTRWACDYIRGEGRDARKPWYLWLCYGAIHTPTIPAERHRGTLTHAPADAIANLFGPHPGKPSYLQKTQAWRRGPNGEPLYRDGKLTHAAWMRQVHECLQAVDEGVGALLQTLEETGQLKNTLVVYTSDQGFANGEHGLRQKVAPYEAAYASPLIISWPGTLPEGKFCPHTVNASDLVVTFFSVAGIELPWKMPGRDLTPLLHHPETAAWNHATFFESTGRDFGDAVRRTLANKTNAYHAGVPYFVAVRHQNLKYIRYLAGDEAEELYDLNADPAEQTNLAGQPEHQATLRQMREHLQEELQFAEADFVEPLPAASGTR